MIILHVYHYNMNIYTNQAGNNGVGIFLLNSSPNMININLNSNTSLNGGGIYLYNSFLPCIQVHDL